jgi:hypothetical protein
MALFHGIGHGAERIARQNVNIATKMHVGGDMVKTPFVSLYCNLLHQK